MAPNGTFTNTGDAPHDVLRGLVQYGVLEIVRDDPDPEKVIYRMPDPDGVEQALRELGAWEDQTISTDR